MYKFCMNWELSDSRHLKQVDEEFITSIKKSHLQQYFIEDIMRERVTAEKKMTARWSDKLTASGVE